MLVSTSKKVLVIITIAVVLGIIGLTKVVGIPLFWAFVISYGIGLIAFAIAEEDACYPRSDAIHPIIVFFALGAVIAVALYP